MHGSKVWFVTGASSGFGQIWTRAALDRGDRVFATARNPQVLADLGEQYGDAVAAAALDVTDREGVFRVVSEARDRFGRLDVILSNAGYSYSGAVEELDFDEAKANFETNVFGTLSVVQAAVPILREQSRGHILTLSSIGGLVGFPTGGSYIATKFAIEAISEALAGEVSGFGIKVTTIEPGSYSTGFRSSTKIAEQMPEYDPIRQAVAAGFKPENTGDAQATAAAVLRVVDSDTPPLRLILGDWPLEVIKERYVNRVALWESWSEVSKAAQR
ncbi:SDR family NAD(P)-dependent oxidoreductase [Mycobacterium sp. 236(2023)]|uniref:SDR family NAD(P)-dependent oxidoreductase n=1 Tax=Mycobacterium sp. 236(2023) TaxID=3038163 RepID=UPI0024157A3D|nr:SDR family NAD(P)-dependent oxidoreductase [Mycobacterium sp. 236(2023)]MDG4668042.1 SDR family NAD(P)-dependent oxidoreductase [Mycobacterium sp. 236(2023)]